MHDYPIVHDGTVIDGVTVLPGGMFGDHNPLQIIMRPTTPEDSLAFWGTEDQQTARLSAYYEVRVVLLEPEQPETWVAPVLSVGTYLYQLGTPHLEQSRSALPFTLPSSGDSLAQVVEISPARASADNTGDPIHHRLELLGSNLSLGKSQQVWLRSAPFTAAAGEALAVDLSLAGNQGAGWSLSTSDEQLLLSLGETLYYDGGGSQIPVLPGHYTAFVRITVGERVVGGQLVPITHDSNEVALTVIPWVSGVLEALDVYTVTIIGFDLSLVTLKVQLYVDGLRYDPALVLADGTYQITGATTLDFQQPLAAGEHTLRLIINGAESQPFWFEF